MDFIRDMATKAKKASRRLSVFGEKQKNDILFAMADALQREKAFIISENEVDVKRAKEKGVATAMIDRLLLNDARIDDMADGLLKLKQLNDPVGEVTRMWKRPNGLTIGRVRVPLGVIGIIYEARPNVTSDAIGLCIKTGNAVILRGGSEAISSNCAISDVMIKAAQDAGLPNGAVCLIKDTSRECATYMMKLNGIIDVLIPRGGAGLIQSVVKNATIPVIETGVGNCHAFIDESADFKMAVDIVINGKVSRPSVCNALESLLVHKNIASEFLPIVIGELKNHGVEVRGCEVTKSIVEDIVAAEDEDFFTEYLDYIISVKVVNGIDGAIEHINTHGTMHSECIVTKDYANAKKFQNEVDAAAVYVNASTRFTDGNEFGFGAEIGISTQKLHARGPMGLNELTTYKYIINGDGQIR